MALAGLVAHSSEVLATAHMGETDPILALATAGADGARLELHDSADGASLRIDLRTRAPAHILTVRGEGNPRVEHTWAMVRGVVLHSERDVLRQAIGWTLRRRMRQREVMRQVYAVTRAVAVAAVARCAVDAHDLAMRFLPHLRFRVYARIVADRSGRIAELVSTCPGALIFALALIERVELPSSVAIGERLLADVVAGRRLRSSLDEAVDGWLATLPELLAWLADGARRRRIPPPELAVANELRGLRRAEIWQRALDPRERTRLRAEQRLLIRRAGTQVATTTLWLPPPIALVPEDIPRATRANARWFRVMKLHPITLARLEEVPAARQAAASQFLSRNTTQVAPGPLATQRAWVQNLVDHARATGRWPCRDSDPARVIDECRRWHHEMTQLEELADLRDALGPGVGPGVDCALPAPRFSMDAFEIPKLALTPLGTARELIEEGRSMQHCVASRLLTVLGGHAMVFRGVADGQRVTVELVRQGGRWTLGDARRLRNEPPSEDATRLIRAWAAIAAEHQQGAEALANYVPPTIAPPYIDIPF